MELKGFLGPTYAGHSNSLDPSRCVNFYPEVNPNPSAKSVLSLVGTPGTVTLATAGSGPIRGAHTFNNLLYFVSGSGVYKWDGTTATLLFSLLTASGQICMLNNGVPSTTTALNMVGGGQLLILDGQYGYVYDIISGLYGTVTLGSSYTFESIPVSGAGYGYTSIPSLVFPTNGLGAKGMVRMAAYSTVIDSVTYAGTNYAIGDVLNLSGGVFTGPIKVTVSHLQATGATIDIAGGGYTQGDVLTVVGGTGTAATFTATTVTDGHVVAVTVLNPGDYTVAPTDPVVVTGGTGTLCQLFIEALLGIKTVTITSAGVYTVLPPAGRLSQDLYSSSTSGTGAQFTVTWKVNDIVIIRGGSGYSVSTVVTLSGGGFTSAATLGTPVMQSLAGGFPSTPVTGTFMDGYFVIVDGGMSHYSSDLYDGSVWRAIAMANCTATSDIIQSVANVNQQLTFVKAMSTELWYDSGIPTTQGSPFSRIPGGVIPIGTCARWSTTTGDNSVFFLGVQNQGGYAEFVGIIQLAGTSYQIVSPPAINRMISGISDITDAFAYIYSDGGHTFYVLTFPTGDRTIVYDITTKMWHERSQYKGVGL